MALDIDYRAELERYDWQRPRWSADKLIAVSPFRPDNSPSFYVWLAGDAAGTWGDSGAIDPEWQRGGFAKLLAYLRGEDESTTREYLRAEYGVYTHEFSYDTPEPIDMSWLTKQSQKRRINERFLDEYSEDQSYLLGRGISEDIQRRAGVLHWPEQQAVVMPWRDGNQRLQTVFYRSTRSKSFWYADNARPTRECLYGIDRVYRLRATTAVLCEAPIDALSAEQLSREGAIGLAVGGASMSAEQAVLIAKSPIERVVVAGDNDAAGARFTERAIEKLREYRSQVAVVVPFEWRVKAKDMNEILVNASNYVESKR